MNDFKSYEEYEIRTKHLSGKQVTIYTHEEFDTDTSDSINGTQSLNTTCNKKYLCQIVSMLKSQGIEYANSSLECEEAFAQENNLIADEDGVKESIKSYISECLDAEARIKFIDDTPAQRELVSNYIDSLHREYRIGDAQAHHYDVQLGNDDFSVSSRTLLPTGNAL